jgi:uncharacterized membrane protein
VISLIPSWAPNLHPLVIHFPIVLLTVASAIDVVDALFERPAWLSTAATSLYVAAAAATAAAYLSGVQAAATVFIPGMAHPAVEDHRVWALLMVWYVVATAIVRVVARLAGFPRARLHRLALLAVGLIGVVLMQQTAERGGRLVYEHGVGVVAAPSAP